MTTPPPQSEPAAPAGLVSINTSALIAGLQNNAIRTRDVQFANRNYFLSLSKHTDADLLAAGFSSDEVADLRELSGYLNTGAEIWYGDANQPDNFDFYDALSILYGGA